MSNAIQNQMSENSLVAPGLLGEGHVADLGVPLGSAEGRPPSGVGLTPSVPTASPSGLRGFAAHPTVRLTRKRKRGERGMTLVEIMVVVVIISLVMGVVGVAVFGTLQQAQRETALTQIRQIGNALDLYKLANRNYPSTGEGLQALAAPKNGAPVMNDIPEDPWGQPYVYVYPGSHNQGGFDLMSYGPDGNAGGGDDVSNWGGIEGQE